MTASLESRWLLASLLLTCGGLLCCSGASDRAPHGSASSQSSGEMSAEPSGAGGAGFGSGGQNSAVEAAAGAEPTAGAAGAATKPAAATPTLNGCAAQDYVDASADDAERVILIAADGLAFTPKCMLVAPGQTVRWQGSLSAHPLSPGSPEDVAAGSPDNPIPATSSGTSLDVTLPLTGTYPYHCQLHSFGTGQGMAGAVHVR